MRTPKRRLVRRPGEPTTSRRATNAFAARLAGSVIGVAGITLMGAGTFGSPAGAFAADRPSTPTNSNACASDQECIQPTAVPSTGNQAGCSGIAGLLKVDSLDSSDSYWHFIVPDAEGYELNGTAFNASFGGANAEVTVTYVQQQKDGGYKGVVVEADGGVTLTWAWVPESGIMGESTEAEGTGAEDSDGNGDFVLSSTCAGGSSSTTTTSSTNSTTSSSTQSTTSSTQSTTSSTQSTASSSSSSSSSQTTSSSSNTTTSSSTTSSTASTPTTTSSNTSSSQTTSSQSSTGLTTTVTDPSTSTSTVSSTSSNAPNPSTGVLGASTTTPSTGADVEFGLGITMLLGGAGVMLVATRINRNKQR